MSKTYYIFRHGETFYTKYRNSRYGLKILSAPILEETKPSIEQLGNYLKNIPTDFNASSQILRCRQTVQIVTLITGKQFVFDKRLNEFFIETVGMFKKRVKNFVDEINSSPHQTILICSHAVVISALKQYITTGDIKASAFGNYSPPGSLIIIKNGKIKELDF